VLDPEERRALVERLLRRTLAATHDATSIDETIVISPDPEVLALASATGAIARAQRSQGLNGALDEARLALAPDTRLLALPGDLATVSAADLDALVALADEAGGGTVVLVTDRHGRGTNALLLDPAGIIPFAFGGDSREAHACLARAAGARLIEPESDLAVDLDTPDDLLLAESIAPEVLGVG
jgi:2-phospho-L-lactate guanylyltransferase